MREKKIPFKVRGWLHLSRGASLSVAQTFVLISEWFYSHVAANVFMKRKSDVAKGVLVGYKIIQVYDIRSYTCMI